MPFDPNALIGTGAVFPRFSTHDDYTYDDIIARLREAGAWRDASTGSQAVEPTEIPAAAPPPPIRLDTGADLLERRIAAIYAKADQARVKHSTVIASAQRHYNQIDLHLLTLTQIGDLERWLDEHIATKTTVPSAAEPADVPTHAAPPPPPRVRREA